MKRAPRTAPDDDATDIIAAVTSSIWAEVEKVVTMPEEVTVTGEIRDGKLLVVTVKAHPDDRSLVWGKNRKTKNRLVYVATKLAAGHKLRAWVEIL